VPDGGGPAGGGRTSSTPTPTAASPRWSPRPAVCSRRCSACCARTRGAPSPPCPCCPRAPGSSKSHTRCGAPSWRLPMVQATWLCTLLAHSSISGTILRALNSK
jgi:hypothetical protein